MQHRILSTMPSRTRSPWRSILAYLGLLLLASSVVAATIPEVRDTSPAYSIADKILKSRQTTINMTAFYERECGVDFVDCGNQACCKSGQECLVGTKSGDLLCRNLPGENVDNTTTSSNTPPSESKPVPVAGIVGGVIGGVVIIAGLCVAYLFYRRRHPPTTPAIPQAPFGTNLLEAKYAPPSETASYFGEHLQPGSYLYSTRNRSVSVSVASTRNATSPTPYDNISPGGTNNFQSLGKFETDAPNIIELPAAVSPPMELPADGYFEEKPQPPPPPPPETNNNPLPKPPSAFLQILKKKRSSGT